MLNRLKKVIFSIILVLFTCADYDLLNLGEPESVKLAIKTVADSSVTLIWSKSDDEDFSNYKVYYSRNETVDQLDSLVDSLSFRVDTVRTVRKLIPGTRYYFRVLVATGRGLFSASNEVDTVTLKDTIAELTEHLKLYAPTNITDSSVTLRWSAYHSLFDSYRVFMDTTWNVTIEDSPVEPVYHDTSLIISNLISNTTYWFRVYVKKDTSYLNESNSIEVRIP